MTSGNDTEFVCVDVRKKGVFCSSERWQLIAARAEMQGQQDVVKAVIASPDAIYRSRYYRGRHTYYKMTVLPALGSTWVRVVAEFGWRPFGGNSGTLVSAFACSGAQEGETLLLGKDGRTSYKIDWDSVGHLENDAEAKYDQEADTLLVQSREHRPAVSVDCDGESWVRVDPKTGEIMGVEIEDFRSFKKAHRAVFKKNEGYVEPVTEVIRLKKHSA